MLRPYEDGLPPFITENRWSISAELNEYKAAEVHKRFE
jgi:hypothetical protein